MLTPVARISPKRVQIVVFVAAITAVVLTGGAAAASAGGGKGGKADKAPPSISITSPVAGANLNAIATVSGSASDNVGVAKVEVAVDGGTYQAASGTTAWTIALNTSSYSNGSHLIAARATDRAGNATITSLTVSINIASPPSDTTPPSVAISLPTGGATVSGTASIAGVASDNTALAKVEISVDGGAYQLTQGTSTWGYSLNTTGYLDGSHNLAARATDGAGNVAAATETISIQNGGSVGQPIPSPPMSQGTIGGYAFEDPNRDRVYETGEQPLGNHNLYLFTSSGAYVANATTDMTGWYEFRGLADGGYVVEYAPNSWWAIRDNWVPDTTGSTSPKLGVQLTNSARADIGWRQIVRSADANAPISSYVGPNGLTVKSYDDVVLARDVYDRLMTGSFVGPEAAYTTIRFDLLSTGSTSTAATALNGIYVSYHATSNISYDSWLDHNGELFHEYGHAWSLYYAYMVQQDPALTGYLQARALAGDPRIGSSYAWNPREMIAEDYRELFGDGSAQADGQLNREIPLANDVPGLREFLSGPFTRPPTG